MRTRDLAPLTLLALSACITHLPVRTTATASAAATIASGIIA